MSDAELKRLIEQKHRIVTTADDDLLSDIAKTQNSLFARIAALVNGLPQRSGKFVWDNNKTKISAITGVVLDAIKNSTYRNKVDQYLRQFDGIESVNKTIVGELAGVKTSGLSLTDEKNAAIAGVAKRLTSPASIESNIVGPISDILYNHARFGLPVSDAINSLRELITETDATGGLLTRYVGQIGRDAINQYNGTVFQVMQREYGLNSYQYVGGLIRDSRPQCIRWINHNEGVLTKDFLDKELAEASRLVLSGGKSDRFKGYSKFTMPLSFETFSIFRGGHNCIHEAIPVKDRNPKVFDGLDQPETFEKSVDRALIEKKDTVSLYNSDGKLNSRKSQTT